MKVTIYIRTEDLQRWNELPNKSQWVHDKLDDKETHESELNTADIRRLIREEVERLRLEYGG